MPKSEPKSLAQLFKWLQSAFDEMELYARCAEVDFFDKLGIADTIEQAFRLACRHGFDAVLPERGCLTPREGLQALGRILAWAERSAKRRLGNWLTPPQAARKLGVSPDTVRGWIASDELKAVNVASAGKRASHRISRDALADFERRRQTKVVKPAVRRRKSETLLVQRY